MGTTMNRDAYEKMCAENIAWLESMPRTLERDHIIQIVRRSPDREYGPLPSTTAQNKWDYLADKLMKIAGLTGDEYEAVQNAAQYLRECGGQHAHAAALSARKRTDG